jgi:hypothetical protein
MHNSHSDKITTKKMQTFLGGKSTKTGIPKKVKKPKKSVGGY